MASYDITTAVAAVCVLTASLRLGCGRLLYHLHYGFGLRRLASGGLAGGASSCPEGGGIGHVTVANGALAVGDSAHRRRRQIDRFHKAAAPSAILFSASIRPGWKHTELKLGGAFVNI
jgi:hypothetical protein